MTGGTKGSKLKFIIFKISDDKKDVLVDEASEETSFDAFYDKITTAKDSQGRPSPRYAVYDVEYDLGSGEGTR